MNSTPIASGVFQRSSACRVSPRDGTNKVESARRLQAGGKQIRRARGTVIRDLAIERRRPVVELGLRLDADRAAFCLTTACPVAAHGFLLASAMQAAPM